MFSKKETARIFCKISVDYKTGCWNWTGYLSDGYGRIFWRGKRYKAHRLIYVWAGNKLQNWKSKKSPELDHICNNRSCVNPNHLKLVSNKTNILRGIGPTAINSKKTHCIHGHILPEKRNKRGERVCKKCHTIQKRKYRHKIKIISSVPGQ